MANKSKDWRRPEAPPPDKFLNLNYPAQKKALPSVVARLDWELRCVRNESDLRALLKLCDEYEWGLAIHGKRRSYHCYGHSESLRNPEVCHYLMGDGKTVNLCRWENLWRAQGFRA